LKQFNNQEQGISGDLKAKYFLRQRISLAIQRGNAASIRGALPETTPLEEIYFL
jgi:hypothetical protein